MARSIKKGPYVVESLVQKIEANLLMRSYEGFTSSGRIKGAYA